MLTIPEQLMLIALKDEKGTVLFTAAGLLPYSIIGGIILELYFAKKIDYTGNNKIVVLDKTPTGIDYFDDVLKILAASSGKKDIKNWLLKINTKIKNIKEETLKHLVSSGVLKMEEQKVLALFTRKTYPTLNPEPEIELRKNIKNFVLQKESPNERNIALLSLAQTTNLLEDIFEQDEVKAAKARINELVERTHMGDAIPEESARLIQGITSGVADASGTGGTI